jgi:hypothetical protein
VFVREVVRCSARDTYRLFRDSIRQGIAVERTARTARVPLVSQREIRDAEAELAEAEEAWRKHGFQRVQVDSLKRQEAVVQARQTELEQWDAKMIQARSARRRLRGDNGRRVMLLKGFRLWESAIAPFLVAVFGVFLAVAATTLVWLTTDTARAILAGLLFLCVTAMLIATWFLSRDWAKGQSTRVLREIRAVNTHIVRMDDAMPILEAAQRGYAGKLDTATQQLGILQRLVALAKRYKRAAAHREELRRLVEGDQYRLITSSWRDFEGRRFVLFLVEVFRALGYSVENTDGPGDGGTDLVATGKGRRISVQAKGYPSGRTVGTEAVQQAHLGKDARRCDVAIVITNSILTPRARHWARMVGCVVIERDGIRDFVLGRHF